jgi:biotin carboxyl carrier protein
MDEAMSERPDAQVTADDGGHEGVEPVLLALPSLLRELAANAVVELDVRMGTARVYVRQRARALPSLDEPLAEAGVHDSVDGLISVTSPLAGVFYGAPAPGEAPFVATGDRVDAGQVVALVEAMKVFNEIHAEVGGEIAEILVSTGQHVRAGQQLMRIRQMEGGDEAPAVIGV